MAAPEAARILARRFSSKSSYRRKRDKKIAVDLIGRTYQWATVDSKKASVVRVVAYNPIAHQVKLQRVWGTDAKWLDTDDFWRFQREGVLVPSCS